MCLSVPVFHANPFKILLKEKRKEKNIEKKRNGQKQYRVEDPMHIDEIDQLRRNEKKTKKVKEAVEIK
jgi:hypothetical protein